MSASYEVKGFITKTNKINVKKPFYLSLVRRPNKLERPSKPSLIFVSEAEVCPRGVPFRCSLLEQASGVSQKFLDGWKGSPETKRPSLLASIGDGKSCITLTPGPNGNKLFTLVI